MQKNFVSMFTSQEFTLVRRWYSLPMAKDFSKVELLWSVSFAYKIWKQQLFSMFTIYKYQNKLVYHDILVIKCYGLLDSNSILVIVNNSLG